MIFNLRELNEFVSYQDFKMESLQDVLTINVPFAWMALVDLKDAFYSVPEHKQHHNYFKFFGKTNFIYLRACPMAMD